MGWIQAILLLSLAAASWRMVRRWLHESTDTSSGYGED